MFKLGYYNNNTLGFQKMGPKSNYVPTSIEWALRHTTLATNCNYEQSTYLVNAYEYVGTHVT